MGLWGRGIGGRGREGLGIGDRGRGRYGGYMIRNIATALQRKQSKLEVEVVEVEGVGV